METIGLGACLKLALIVDMVDLAERFPVEAKLVIGSDQSVPGFEADSLLKTKVEFCLPR